MGTIGIIGTAEVDAELAGQSLSDLRDAAVEAGEHFDVIFSLREDAPESLASLVDWCIENEVSYWLVVHPAFAENVPEEYTNSAERTLKTKTCDAKTVEIVLEYQGGPLLVLAAETDQPEEVINAAVAANEAGVAVLDLADALTEIPFGEGTTDAGAPAEEGGTEEPEEEIDFEALGTAADTLDEDAAAQLTELASVAGLDPDAYPTWIELAEALYELANAAAGAESNAPDDSDPGTGWTKEALDAKTLKELRSIATQSGIADAAKLSMAAVKKALLALDSAPSEPEEAPVAPSPKAKSPGKPVANGAGTDNAELNEAVQLIIQGFTRLANVIAS